MSRTILDLHVLQTVPPSNLNRDDTGSPKTAVYGGVRRARVSSQAWKRATRKAFSDVLDQRDLGLRTRRVVEVLADAIAAQAPELTDRRADLAAAALKAVGLKVKAAKRDGAADEAGYLVFLSRRQIDNLASAAVQAASVGDVDKALKEANVKALANRDHSIDVALFGRMVADVTDLNVDAAAQVAHAISVHAVDNEYDYFTAVDDHKAEDKEEDAGAGMIGTVEFNSSTLYRYATLDVDRLGDNLGDATATQRAAEAFVRAFVTSMPTGKQNTFANRTLPDAVVVRLRSTQPISFVGAFEEPVAERDSTGRVLAAATRMADYALAVEAAYDETPEAAWAVTVGERTAPLRALGENVTLDGLVAAVGAAIAERAGAR